MFISRRTTALTQQLKALADPQRLRIIALCRGGEVSVGELVRVLGQSQPRVSQHLKLLCDAGLLQRFRDGKFAYFRLPETETSVQRRLVALIDDDEPQFVADRDALLTLRGSALDDSGRSDADDSAQRALARAFIELTLAAPLGNLLDIGCGKGRLLKLLASRAKRAVGVDLDAQARNLARAELYVAGVQNCSLRQGDMYRLVFEDASFDTVVVDEVLADAADPQAALREASRVLKPGGRLLVLTRLDGTDRRTTTRHLADWSKTAGLRLAQPRALPEAAPQWLLSVMTIAGNDAAAA